MRGFIIEIIVFTLIAMFCFSVFGQDWQDEEHVWNEETGEWEVENRVGGRVVNTEPSQENTSSRPFKGQPWEKYLSKNVKYGKRPPTEWELNEAQRKLWASQVMKERAAIKGQQRRDLIAHRKATGWYADRRNAGLAFGASAHNMTMQHVSNSMNNMRYGNVQHYDSCAPSRFGQNIDTYYVQPQYRQRTGGPSYVQGYTQPRIYRSPGSHSTPNHTYR